MARGVRKAANDSTTAQLKSVREDRTGATAPRDVFGVDLLTNVGLEVYDDLYRSRADWSIGDLQLIAQAASIAERIRELQTSLLPGTTLLTTPTTIKLHPAINAINDQRRLFANMLRDAKVRSKDGAEPVARTSPEILAEPVPGENGGFDAWVNTLQ